MPYIEQMRRDEIDPLIAELLMEIDDMSKGDINYIITRIVAARYANGGYENRSKGAEVFGDAKTEYERRVMTPYEEKKIQENGDIPEYIYIEVELS